MRAGALDRIVLFQSLASAVDSVGSPVETWSTLSGAPIRAEYIPLKGNERVEAGKLTDTPEFKLRIRRDVRISARNRVMVGGETCRIISIEDYGRAGEMILWCNVKR